MSTPRGGAHGAGEPTSDALGMSDPGLEHLIKALTASGHPAERTGRDAALAAFRTANTQRGRSTHRSGRHGSRRILLPVRTALVTGASIAVLAGVTAAAYAQALPASFQRIAHSVLAPLGVPDTRQLPAAPRTPPVRTAPGPAHSSSAAGDPGTGSSPGAPSPSPSGVVTPSWAASGSQMPSSTRTANSAGRSSAATPTGTSTPAVLSIRLHFVSGPALDHLIANISVPSGRPGGTVLLTELSGGKWQTVSTRSRGGTTQVKFQIPANSAAGHLFRAKLFGPGTGKPVVSNVISVPDSASNPAK